MTKPKPTPIDASAARKAEALGTPPIDEADLARHTEAALAWNDPKEIVLDVEFVEEGTAMEYINADEVAE